MRRYQKFLFLGAMAVALSGLVGCGKGNPPPAPAPQPPPGSQQPQGLGGGLTDPSPGTPLAQNQQGAQQAIQILQQNVRGYGQATIRSQLVFNFVVQPMNQQYQYQPSYPQQQYDQYGNPQFQQQAPQSQWQLLGQPQQEPVQIPTSDAAANGTAIRLTNNYEGARTFSFTYQVSLDGITLYSTDQVALYEGRGADGSYAILKVAYRSQNPVMQEYTIAEQGGGYGYGRRYRVVQKVYATQFAYPPQQQQQPYPQQYQQPYPQPYGGQQYTNNDGYNGYYDYNSYY